MYALLKILRRMYFRGQYELKHSIRRCSATAVLESSIISQFLKKSKVSDLNFEFYAKIEPQLSQKLAGMPKKHE